MEAPAWLSHALEQAVPWMASDGAGRSAVAYRNHYLERYLRLRAEGADEGALAHSRGNARGRFYEAMVIRGVARAITSLPGLELVCAGGTTPLRGGALVRDEKGDVVLGSPSYPGGPAIVRAEFDALVWDPAEGPVLLELTASSANLPDLVSDLWRKQLVTMRAFALAVPPRVVLISPHALPSIPARVARLLVRTVGFPEKLWNDALERGGRRPPDEAPSERVGPALRGARDPGYAILVPELAGAFVAAVGKGDVAGFCSDRRDDMAMARRIYVGALAGTPLHEASALLAELSRHRGDDALSRAVFGGATVHLTLRVEGYQRPIRPVVHVVTRASGAPGELRIHADGRVERVTDFHKAAAFRSEIPTQGGRVLTPAFISAAATACLSGRVLEPTIRALPSA